MFKVVPRPVTRSSHILYLIPRASKYTAPDLRTHANTKYGVIRKPYPRKPKNVDIPRLQVEVMHKKNKEVLEARNEDDMFKFESKVTTLESQMASLKTKGFLRSYQSYTPPPDVEDKFVKCLETVFGDDSLESLKKKSLTDKETKLKALNALNHQFSHKVHNSRIHLMKTVDDLLTYYKAPVVTSTPYKQLHEDMLEGSLPDNLVVQLDAIRFTGEGDHPLNTVTAFPRRNTIVTNIKHLEELGVAPKKKHSKYQEEDYN